MANAAFAATYSAEGGFAPLSVDGGVHAVSSWAVRIQTYSA